MTPGAARIAEEWLHLIDCSQSSANNFSPPSVFLMNFVESGRADGINHRSNSGHVYLNERTLYSTVMCGELYSEIVLEVPKMVQLFFVIHQGGPTCPYP